MPRPKQVLGYIWILLFWVVGAICSGPGQPFDITIEDADGTFLNIIEVKSTNIESKARLFEISVNELNTAFQYPGLYDVIRVVFNGTSATMIWIDKIADRALAGNVRR